MTSDVLHCQPASHFLSPPSTEGLDDHGESITVSQSKSLPSISQLCDFGKSPTPSEFCFLHWKTRENTFQESNKN